MARQAFVAASRSPARVPRPAVHLVERRAFRPTPELFAGLAILSLVSVSLFGFYGVLLFFASTGVVVAFRPLFNLRELIRFSPLLALPILAVLSTIWSDAPQRSMRMGLELFATAAAAIIVCRNLRAERLVLALFAAFLALTLLVTPAAPQAIATNTPLVGWMGSKNSVGFVAFMLFALSLAIVCDRRQPGPARLAAIGALPFAIFIAGLAQSGGTKGSIALTLLAFPPLALLVVLKPPLRVAVTALAICVLAVAAFFLDDIEALITDFRQNVLKKDATLTGRTYLWDFADRLSAARPVWGYGYQAFWRQGNIDAEGLWRWGGIASRSGFNFHNAFVAIRVDLGMVGLVLLIATCVGIAAVAIARQIARPSMPMASLLAITAVNYSRSFVEEGLVGPFSFVTVIWLATALYAFAPSGPAGSAEPGRGDRPAPRGEPGDRAGRFVRSGPPARSVH